MSEFVFERLSDFSGLNINTILLNNVVTVVVGLFIMLTYRLTYSGTAYSKKFNVSIGMITFVTTLIVSVISNNIALALGMVGALSIIRFRTAVKDVRDASFIFWCISVGICCGVSQYLLAGISSGFIFIFLLAMKQTHPEGKILLIIRSNLEAQNKVQTTIEQYFIKSAHLRMKNANAQGCEFVYELSQHALRKAKAKTQIDIVEKLLKISGVINVNQVEQTDDISR